MKNLLNRPVTRFGMPYHGLVTDGVLTTPDGPLAVAHDASVEGAIAFRTRNPPGNIANTAQQAMDTLHGWEWRDYVLLNGWFRSVNGGPQLGEARWLFADYADTVWVMEITKSYRLLAGVYYVDIQLWRRELFGHFLFGFERTIADELLDTWTFVMTSHEYDDDGTPVTIPAGTMVANLRIKASGIVPSIHGDTVYFHLLHLNHQVMPETRSYWELSQLGVFGKATITLSGTGDVDNDGAGITGVISGGQIYPSFVTRAADVPQNYATIDPWPLGHIASEINESDCTPPTGPGTCTSTCSTVFTHQGTIFNNYGPYQAWDDIGDAQAALFDFHGGACTQWLYHWEKIDGQLWLAGPGMEFERTYTAVETSPGVWAWELSGEVETCGKWKESSSDHYLYADVGVSIAGAIDEILVSKHDESWSASPPGTETIGGCACVAAFSDDGFPDPATTFSRTYSFSEPYTLDDASAGVYCDGVSQQAVLMVFPGIVGYVASHAIPPANTTVAHRGKLYGIAEDGTLTEITAWSETEAGTVITFPWTAVAWQPVTKEFNVQSDGVTLVKYI